jgi:transposase
MSIEVVYPRCAGLDVHKRVVVACALVPGPDGRVTKALQTFGTMADDLLALGDWLLARGVTHVALESTGVYWHPIWNLLEGLEGPEGRLTLLLVNAQHVKRVPGRKTDVADAEWLADLLRHGLLRGSFVPDRGQRDLRALTRYRTSLVRERADAANRLQKTLEGANVKLASVAADILGKSGRAMLDALVAGGAQAADPHALANLAQRRLRQKLPELERALTVHGQFGAHQRFLVAQQLAHIDFLDAAIARISAEIRERLRPFDATLARLDTIPGVGRTTAEALLAELGTEMTRFPTAKHLASWAGMCPGNKESAGKRLSGKTRKGNPWLRALLVEAAHGAARTRGTYLQAQYRRLATRRGAKRAALAVGHTLLVIVYHLLSDPDGTMEYHDLGATYFDERDRATVQRRLIRRLEALGHTVTLSPLSTTSPPEVVVDAVAA